MSTIEKFQNRLDGWVEQFTQYLERLSVRERVMVIFTMVFVLVAAVGSALWYMHKAAEYQQQRVSELKDLVVWMQSNAVTMKPAGDVQLSAAEKVQRAAQQQGLGVASQQVGEQIQVVVSHANYSILANFLTQLAQMGLSIEKMELQSNAGQIKLTATLQ
ncbi:type II secretion system protein GspM [Acinetobacter tandoii]|uniref:General secretion pathway protein M n=1 Tax=Acinetobacter tandoii DSM 14970 = CIP 107469 TaxID=1120927 RepID=R9AUC9_9GAMM|nr:type II secretion system protein GspM [Acinetobacter tandoii]EOR05778.1 general secretion pathway protein M [Acinetobacter tandoii DSM 14970 = CIP 107469]